MAKAKWIVRFAFQPLGGIEQKYAFEPVEAESEREAIEKMIDLHYPGSEDDRSKHFLRGCMQADRVIE